MSNTTLVDALKRFDRKQRYWLIRNAFGPAGEQLDDGFRTQLAEAIGTDVPATAWSHRVAHPIDLTFVAIAALLFKEVDQSSWTADPKGMCAAHYPTH